MKAEFRPKPRRYLRGGDDPAEVRDVGALRLEPGEMVALVGREEGRIETTAAPWGFYAAPAINGRLRQEGYRAALARDGRGDLFLLFVREERTEEIRSLFRGGFEFVRWLDEEEATTRGGFWTRLIRRLGWRARGTEPNVYPMW